MIQHTCDSCLKPTNVHILKATRLDNQNEWEADVYFCIPCTRNPKMFMWKDISKRWQPMTGLDKTMVYM